MMKKWFKAGVGSRSKEGEEEEERARCRCSSCLYSESFGLSSSHALPIPDSLVEMECEFHIRKKESKFDSSGSNEDEVELRKPIVNSFDRKSPSTAGSLPPLESSSWKQFNFNCQPIRKGVVTELTASQVRWFYRGPEDKKTWIPFNGRDSLIIEVKWRLETNAPIDSETAYEVLPLCSGKVAVLGGLYQLNLEEKQIVPLYWKASELSIMRGTWFLENWQPVDPKYCDLIEAQHLKVFRGQKIPDKPVLSGKDKPPVVTKITCEGIEVEWNSIIDIYFCSTTKKYRIVRYLGLYQGRHSLYRGFHTECSLFDVQKPIGHAIFVVHGIGQKRNVNRIVRNTAMMQSVLERLFEKHYSDEDSRVIFLPVEWRSLLVLDGDRVENITIPHQESVRETLNCTAMDILYYTSPRYRSEITRALVDVLNELYRKFVENNPDFLERNGKISIFAHSLGSVITYDILTRWTPLQLYEECLLKRIEEHIQSTGSLIDNNVNSAKRILSELELKGVLSGQEEPRVEFAVENLYCVGSPLAVFLTLRDLQGAESVLGRAASTGPVAFKQLFNIFHPSDPVAYRLEPLFHPGYKYIRPLRIHSHGEALKKLDYDRENPELSKKYSKKKTNPKDTSRSPENTSTAMTKVDKTISKNGENTKWVVAAAEDNESDTETSISTPSSPELQRREAPKKKPKKEQQDSSSGVWWLPSFRRAQNADLVSVSNFAKSPSESSLASTASYSELRSKGMEKEGKNEEKEKDTMEESGGEKPSSQVEEFENVQEVLEQIPENMRLKQRLDYEIREGMTEVSYWTVFRSHFSYWSNSDVVMFILSSLYSGDGAEKEKNASSSQKCLSPKKVFM